MQGKKSFTPQLFVSVNLLDLVPEDNFTENCKPNSIYISFTKLLKSIMVARRTKESIDPVVFFKILLVGYLNNINSDRQLIAFCSDSLSIRLFLVMMYMSSFLGTVPLAELAVLWRRSVFKLV